MDKGYWFVDEIICKNTELTEADFQETYPLATRWSRRYHVEIDTVNPNAAAGPQTGTHPVFNEKVEKIHVFDTNIQKQLLAEYE